jgi:hypothetical protein
MSVPSKYCPTAIALLWPMVFPVAIFLPVELNFLFGGVVSAHGPLAGLLLLASGWGGCALVWEIIALPFFVNRLRLEPAFRTRFNIFTSLAASIFIALSIGLGINLINLSRV